MCTISIWRWNEKAGLRRNSVKLSKGNALEGARERRPAHEEE
jgi:hypothetical protein